MHEISKRRKKGNNHARPKTAGVLRKPRHEAAQDEVCVRAKRGGVSLYFLPSPALLSPSRSCLFSLDACCLQFCEVTV